MTIRRYSLPRIFYVHPRHLGAIETDGDALAAPWAGTVERAADLGFAQLLIGSNEETPQALALLAAECRSNGLSLWVDLSLGEAAVGSAQALALPHHYLTDTPAGDVLDPRRATAAQRHARLAWTPGNAAAWTGHWAARLRDLALAGVSGFNFLLPHRIPVPAWQALLEHRLADFPDCHLLAWTPGVPRDALPSLGGVGFDTVFGSLAWWDFRSAWLWEERRVLDTVGQVAGFPESPYEVTGIHAYGDPALRGRAARRALWAAATLGHGWLVPMGFENGASIIADPIDTARQATAVPDAPLDLAAELRAANRWIAALPAAHGEVRALSGVDAAISAVWRRQTPMPSDADDAPAAVQWLVLVNPDIHLSADVDWQVVAGRLPGDAQRLGAQASSVSAEQAAELGPRALEPAELRVVMLEAAPPVLLLGKATRPALKKQLATALHAPRVAVENIEPAVDGGRFALKRTPGQAVTVEADVFMDGHDKVGVALLWRAADTAQWTRSPMIPLGNDRWRGSFMPERIGLHYYVIEAWRDIFASYRDELSKKHAAGVDVSLELEEVRPWVAAVLAAGQKDGETETLRRESGAALERLNAFTHSAMLEWLLSDASLGLVEAIDSRQFASRSSPELAVDVERRRRSSPAGTSCSRARSPAIRRGTAPSTTSSAACRRSATWASTSSTSRRSIRSARPTARAATTR